MVMGKSMTHENTNWYSEDRATLGDRIAAAREATGLDHAGLAKRTGVKLKTIKAWEDDLTEPRSNRLLQLSGVLNVSIIWLLTGEGEDLSQPHEEDAISTDVKDILIDIRELKAQFKQNAEQLGRLEKKLRATLINEHDG